MAATFASSSRPINKLQSGGRDLLTPKYHPHQLLRIAASLHFEICGPLKSFGMDSFKINTIFFKKSLFMLEPPLFWTCVAEYNNTEKKRGGGDSCIHLM